MILNACHPQLRHDQVVYYKLFELILQTTFVSTCSYLGDKNYAKNLNMRKSHKNVKKQK